MRCVRVEYAVFTCFSADRRSSSVVVGMEDEVVLVGDVGDCIFGRSSSCYVGCAVCCDHHGHGLAVS